MYNQLNRIRKGGKMYNQDIKNNFVPIEINTAYKDITRVKELVEKMNKEDFEYIIGGTAMFPFLNSYSRYEENKSEIKETDINHKKSDDDIEFIINKIRLMDKNIKARVLKDKEHIFVITKILGSAYTTIDVKNKEDILENETIEYDIDGIKFIGETKEKLMHDLIVEISNQTEKYGVLTIKRMKEMLDLGIDEEKLNAIFKNRSGEDNIGDYKKFKEKSEVVKRIEKLSGLGEEDYEKVNSFLKENNWFKEYDKEKVLSWN